MIGERELIWIGGDIDRVSVTLRFSGDDLDPAFVSTLLGAEPTQAFRKGDMISRKHSQSVSQTGRWHLRRPQSKGALLEEQINELLSMVSSDLSAWRELEKYNGDLFCGLFLNEWNRGCRLSSGMIRKIAERRLILDLDIIRLRLGKCSQ